MTLIKVLPAFTKAPGVPARTEGVTETKHKAKRESGGSIWPKSREEKNATDGESKRVDTLLITAVNKTSITPYICIIARDTFNIYSFSLLYFPSLSP